jgi:hypothetical protein
MFRTVFTHAASTIVPAILLAAGLTSKGPNHPAIVRLHTCFPGYLNTGLSRIALESSAA